MLCASSSAQDSPHCRDSNLGPEVNSGEAGKGQDLQAPAHSSPQDLVGWRQHQHLLCDDAGLGHHYSMGQVQGNQMLLCT